VARVGDEEVVVFSEVIAVWGNRVEDVVVGGVFVEEQLGPQPHPASPLPDQYVTTNGTNHHHAKDSRPHSISGKRRLK